MSLGLTGNTKEKQERELEKNKMDQEEATLWESRAMIPELRLEGGGLQEGGMAPWWVTDEGKDPEMENQVAELSNSHNETIISLM